ncbi:uncharacterized protein DUF2591 [Yokenella regensburgei]|uniref:Uncharacterized protein DUF2591 n=1 Tax=Yokenella regensburgei TaxID=158877 RepID=A0ABX9RT82_9ENTR|nr:phage protein NinX family protein [Yokenella regensburgei]RKR53205.1 uncharacterized protein DUF2591 [Yokenella regensburgei]VFS16077.1 Protein of uncharacterised function (DUF2591) [Yokenella regensburgei]
MDYSKLSDAEIAQKVWFWCNQNIEHDNTLCGRSGGEMLYVKNSVWTVFDPCNNPADAWPIIVANKINIEWHQWKDDTDKPYALSNATMISRYDDTPLRAAMIVFLMMQDKANANP